ncbi:hypothetical protein NHE_0301 [Neorickettsia helminthoeca str. Oregon]|uniref:Uncharacterized protein n=1 Tax=Neorickettsia helminthoeca str. Oregon TaxID=1286528 RepID=X5HLI6_9RICK|nr:hypothetical protein NHE_0301 [Neorickettsia helminthoeca str. Oregon]
MSGKNTVTLEEIRRNQNTFIFIDSNTVRVVKAKNWAAKSTS